MAGAAGPRDAAAAAGAAPVRDLGGAAAASPPGGAARYGLGFIPTIGDEDLTHAYVDACVEAEGRDPGVVVLPADRPRPRGRGPRQAWAQVGDHLLHDAGTYASWQPAGQRTHITPRRRRHVEGLRAAKGYLPS